MFSALWRTSFVAKFSYVCPKEAAASASWHEDPDTGCPAVSDHLEDPCKAVTA